jgi:hypothetical protein
MEKEIQVGGEAEAPHDKRHLYVTWGAIIVAVASIVASFMIVNNTGANADYICTHVVEETGNCTNGSWGDWTTVSSSDDDTACAVNKVEKRTYTGTRTTRHILQYLNLRTACDGGYAQSGNGEGGGASGFHGGTIVTESAACQIEETRTTRNQGNNCEAPVTDVVSATTDIAALNHQSTSVSGIDQLTAFRVTMIAANIYAKPSLVRSGGTTVIKWQSRETTACTVVGTNGDTWEGTAGEKTSGVIASATTYTLTCTAFNGQTVTDQATVTIIPTFEEL